MAEAKPLASLSSGLLARKGAARPAMRRQGLSGTHSIPHDDLGWNDMGYDVDPSPTNDDADFDQPNQAMLSPMGASREAGEDIASQGSEDDEKIARISQSPLSVKSAKPVVVLQREELADKVAGPAKETDDEIVERKPFASLVVPEKPAPQIDDIISPEPHSAEIVAPPSPIKAEARPVPTPRVTPTLPKAPRPSRTKCGAGNAKAKAAFTLRIDAERHLRLRLASALTNLSAQQILTDAFDAYLKTLPQVEALAGNIAGSPNDGSPGGAVK